MRDLRIGVVTVSGRGSCIESEDVVGRALIEAVESYGWIVVAYHCCPSDAECIASSMIEICDADEADVLLTVGGTGLHPSDIAPEVTERVCERVVPGLAEFVREDARKNDPTQALSRGTAGMRGNTLLLNLPNGEQAVSSFRAVTDLLESAVDRIHEER